MDNQHLQELLTRVSQGQTSVEDAMKTLKTLPFEDLDFVNIDNHRSIRTGWPEAVFCQGKTSEQIAAIMERLVKDSDNIIGTRATRENYEAVLERVPDAVYYEMARIIVAGRKPEQKTVLPPGNSSPLPLNRHIWKKNANISGVKLQKWLCTWRK